MIDQPCPAHPRRNCAREALLALAACAALAGAAPCASVAAAPPANKSPDPPPVALVTGSDRGIGLALTQELESRGWRVIATCREPARADALGAYATAHPRVTIEALDVTDNAQIEALAARYKGQPIDALINNAGIADNLGKAGFGDLSPERFAQVMRVNTYAPLKIAYAFLDQVGASRQKKIVALSSGLGSLFQAPQFRSSTYYSISKAGLNMAMRLLQSEVQERGIVVGIVSPGPVDTDMQKAYRAAAAQSGQPITTPALSPADSARGLADYIESLGPARAGRFYSFDGRELPW